MSSDESDPVAIERRNSRDNLVEALKLAREALELAREQMRSGPLGIDPMMMMSVEKWRSIEKRVRRLESCT